MTLVEFFETVYSPLKLRGRSENTKRLYHCTIRSLRRFLGRDPQISDLDDLTLARFLSHRAETRSPFTSEKERTQLVSLWRFARERGVVSTSPCVPPTPLPERIPTAWSVESVRSVIKAASEEKGFVCGVPAGTYFQALCSVLWETAERIGAVLSLKVLDYQNGQILCRAEYRKGKKRDKLYTLSPGTRRLIDEMIRGKKPNDAIFRWHKQKTNLWYAFGKIVERAGLGKGRNAKFHMLRRSSATHFAAAGGDAVALLDHSSPRICKAYYLDPRFLQSGPPPCDVLPSIN